MNLVDMTEVRVESHKLQLPARLTGSETGNQRAISFYATAGNLEQASKDISAQGRINALATNVNLNHIVEFNLRAMFNGYLEQVFDPSGWTITSFHDHTGRKLTNSTIANDASILKSSGSATANTVGANLCEENISFAQIRATVDLSHITKRVLHMPPGRQEI